MLFFFLTYRSWICLKCLATSSLGSAREHTRLNFFPAQKVRSGPNGDCQPQSNELRSVQAVPEHPPTAKTAWSQRRSGESRSIFHFCARNDLFSHCRCCQVPLHCKSYPQKAMFSNDAVITRSKYFTAWAVCPFDKSPTWTNVPQRAAEYSFCLCSRCFEWSQRFGAEKNPFHWPILCWNNPFQQPQRSVLMCALCCVNIFGAFLENLQKTQSFQLSFFGAIFYST